MAESTYSRKLDAMGRIMIPVRLRDQLGLITGREYSFEVRQIDGRNYICIDCGLNTELEEAMKLVQNAGLKVVRTVIANGLEKEAHGKVIDEKQKNWNEKN